MTNLVIKNMLGVAMELTDKQYKPSMEVYTAWLKHSFKKRIVEVSDAKFEKAKEILDHAIMRESTLNGLETAIAFCPRYEWPQFFKNLMK